MQLLGNGADALIRNGRQSRSRVHSISSEAMDQILQMIEGGVNSSPSAIELEMAYQARVAIGRIRFAIRVTGHSPDQPERLREANLHLLDALSRVETADRGFQQKFQPRWRRPSSPARSMSVCHLTFRKAEVAQPPMLPHSVYRFRADCQGTRNSVSWRPGESSVTGDLKRYTSGCGVHRSGSDKWTLRRFVALERGNGDNESRRLQKRLQSHGIVFRNQL
jgi:hypothetical protein